MKHIIIVLLFLLPITVSAQLLRSYGVVEIGSTFPTSSVTGAKFAYRTTDSSYYRWVSGNTWVKIIEPSIIPDTLYLTEEIGTSYKVSGDTINLTPYLLKSDTSAMLVRYIERGDTASMLTNYPSTAGYGILKSSKTIRADTTSPNGLATRLFTKTLPTSIIADRSIRSNGSNLVVGNFTDNGTKLESLLPHQLALYTTATLPTGVKRYMLWDDTKLGIGSYDGTRWNYIPNAAKSAFTSTYVPFTNSSGQFDEDSNFFFTSSGVKKLTVPAGTSASNSNGLEFFGSNLGAGGAGFYFSGGILNIRSDNNTRLAIGNAVADLVATNAVFRLNTKTIFNTPTATALQVGSGYRDVYIDPTTGTTPTRIFMFGTSNGNNIKFRMLSTTGFLGLNMGTTDPRYQLDVTSTDAFAFPRGTVAQRPTIVSSTTPFRFNTDSTALEYGESVGTWRLLATRAYARSLVSALPTTNIYTANGTLTSNRTITSGGFDLTLDTDVTVGDSLKVTTTPAHSAITGLLTRNTDGWVGLASLAGGLSYSGGVLTGANIYTADGNLGDNVTRTFSQGSNGDFVKYRTDIADKLNKTYLSIPTGNADYDDEARILYQSGGTKNRKISHYKAGGIYDGLGNYIARYQTSERNSADNYVLDQIYASIGLGSTANFAGVLVGADSTNLNTISALKMITENAASKRTHWAGLIDNSYGNGGWGGLGNRFISYSPSYKIQTNFFNSNTYYDWLRIDNLDTDTTSNRISLYNGKYAFPNASPGSGDKIIQWSSGTPSFVSVSSFSDGNGIYTGSGTLASHTTRARIPDNGNLYFGQRFNSNADSSYWYIANYGDGERELAFGITDTASTGFTGGTFYSDGAGEMNWELETSGASGVTSVKAQNGAFSVVTTGGNMTLNAGVENEVAVTGLVKAKQEAYNIITSTSSPQTLSSTYSDNLINQGGTQATFTLNMPASPDDGQVCYITFNNAISALTIDGNGNTIVGSAVTTGVAGSQRKFKFYSGIGWIKQY